MTRVGIARVILVAAAAGMLGGCMVPETRYDQAQSNLRREQAAHRHTLQQLHEAQALVRGAEQQAQAARAEARDSGTRVEVVEKLLAQAKLDASVVAREREEAVQLVDQLRGELARVGEHLRSFAHDKTELRDALAAAEDRLDRLSDLERSVAFRAMVIRDLALALYEPLATGEYELSVVDGRIVLRVPAARVYAGDGGELHPEAKQLLGALARVSQRYGQAFVAVTETGGEGRDQQELTVRLKRVSDGLVAEGLNETSVTITVPDQPTVQTVPAAEGEGEPEGMPAATPPEGTPAAVEPEVIQFAIAEV